MTVVVRVYLIVGVIVMVVTMHLVKMMVKTIHVPHKDTKADTVEN